MIFQYFLVYTKCDFRESKISLNIWYNNWFLQKKQKHDFVFTYINQFLHNIKFFLINSEMKSIM